MNSNKRSKLLFLVKCLKWKNIKSTKSYQNLKINPINFQGNIINLLSLEKRTSAKKKNLSMKSLGSNKKLRNSITKKVVSKRLKTYQAFFKGLTPI